MARSRLLKPSFFRNERLLDLPYEYRLLFAGLWVLADREGRLENRPKMIRMEIFPCDNINIEDGLLALKNAGFISFYKNNTMPAPCQHHASIVPNIIECIQIVNFSKHQHPHKDERANPDLHPIKEDILENSTMPAPCQHHANTPLTLNPLTITLNPLTEKPCLQEVEEKPQTNPEPTTQGERENGFLQGQTKPDILQLKIEFDEFFDYQPERNANRDNTFAAFKEQRLAGARFEAIMSGVEDYKTFVAATKPEKLIYPVTFLRNKRYAEDWLKLVPKTPKSPKPANWEWKPVAETIF